MLMVRFCMITVDSIYRFFFKVFLSRVDPEFIHNLVLAEFSLMSKIEILRCFFSRIFRCIKPIRFMGIDFPNPIGLAAGFDKNGEVFDFIEVLGFGFCEIGSVSLRPQKGNPKPRIFRIVDEEALINHIGLENKGSYVVARNIERKRHKVKFPIGINIVKNNDVDFDKTHINVAECFKVLKDLGDFFVFNISCPNVREFKGDISDYLTRISDRIVMIDDNKPKFFKISPDVSDIEIKRIVEVVRKYGFGIVATNTTKKRNILNTRDFDYIEGGLSGRPLSELSYDVVKKIKDIDNGIPVIACGGIFDISDIKRREKLGVSVFEIYTSFIYRGPGIVKKLCERL